MPGTFKKYKVRRSRSYHTAIIGSSIRKGRASGLGNGISSLWKFTKFPKLSHFLSDRS